MNLNAISRLVVYSTASLLASVSACFAGGGGGCVGGPGTSIPEPATLSLLGAGAGAVVAYRWWKSRR